MLDEYRRQVQRFIRDSQQKYVDVGDIDSYINRARREVAMRSQSIRILTPIAGSILNIQVTAGGSGYAAPVVTISTPDAPNGALPNPAGLQATATAQFIGGTITGISVNEGGDGYFQPVVTITDPTGTGATAAAYTNPINVTTFQQEIYNFKDVNLSAFPGVGAIFAVKSVSIIYANYRYSLPCYSFSTYQSAIRQYPRQYIYVPTVMGQYGQGTSGSLYMYPIPSSPYQMEWDCFCLPHDLTDDGDFEALPAPWTETVPFYAAHMCYLEMQNLNAGKFYLDLYDQMVHRYSSYARPWRTVNPYGRYIWPIIIPLLGAWIGFGC
jgi:hypothetical protein